MTEHKALGILVPLFGILLGVNYELGTWDTAEVHSITVPIEVIADPPRRGSCQPQLGTECA